MHLRDRRRRQRLMLKRLERGVGMDAELALEHADDLVPGHRGCAVKDVGERLAVRFREDRGLDREGLRELDVHADVLLDEARQALRGPLMNPVDFVRIERVKVQLEIEREGDAEDGGAETPTESAGVVSAVVRIQSDASQAKQGGGLPSSSRLSARLSSPRSILCRSR